MKFFIKIVQDLSGIYYAEVMLGDNTQFEFSTHTYNRLKEAIQAESGITIPLKKQLIFQTYQGRKYAFVDGTQPCPHGCVVTLDELLAGHKPDFS